MFKSLVTDEQMDEWTGGDNYACMWPDVDVKLHTLGLATTEIIHSPAIRFRYVQLDLCSCIITTNSDHFHNNQSSSS